MPTIIARPYAASDRTACLALFDGNVPRFFAVEERAAFADFLDRRAADWSYQLLVIDGNVVACGGHALVDDDTTALLCWGIVDAARQGTGLGTRLTTTRIDTARACPTVRRVRLDTSQHTAGFYRRFGFVAEAITANGYGPGLDRCDMTLPFDTE